MCGLVADGIVEHTAVGVFILIFHDDDDDEHCKELLLMTGTDRQAGKKEKSGKI